MCDERIRLEREVSCSIPITPAASAPPAGETDNPAGPLSPACKGMSDSWDLSGASTQLGLFWGGKKQLGVFRALGRAGCWHTFSLQCREEESGEQTAALPFLRHLGESEWLPSSPLSSP